MKREIIKLGSDSLIYGFGASLSKSINIFLIPLLTRIFSPTQYGIIDVLQISSLFLSISLGLNIATGIQKFYFENNIEKRKIVITNLIGIGFISSFSIIVIFIVFAEKFSLLLFSTNIYKNTIIFMLICIPLRILYDNLCVLLRVNQKSKLFVIINTCEMALTTIFIYMLVVHGQYAISGYFLAQFICLLILNLYLLQRQYREFLLVIDSKIIRNNLLFCLYGHPGLLLTALIELLPRYFLLMWADLFTVGIYALSNKIARLLNIAILGVQRAWNPYAFSINAKKDEKNIYETVFRYYVIIFFIPTIFICLFSREIVFILTPKEYHFSAYFIEILCFSYYVNGLRIIYSVYLFAKNRPLLNSIITLWQIVIFFIISYFLVPTYKLYGLAIAHLISSVFLFLAYHRTNKEYFSGIHSKTKKMYVVILLGIICIFIYALLQETNLSIYHIVSKILIFTFLVILSFHVGLITEEKGFIINYFNYVKKNRIGR